MLENNRQEFDRTVSLAVENLILKYGYASCGIIILKELLRLFDQFLFSFKKGNPNGYFQVNGIFIGKKKVCYRIKLLLHKGGAVAIIFSIECRNKMQEFILQGFKEQLRLEIVVVDIAMVAEAVAEINAFIEQFEVVLTSVEELLSKNRKLVLIILSGKKSIMQKYTNEIEMLRHKIHEFIPVKMRIFIRMNYSQVDNRKQFYFPKPNWIL